LQFRGHTSPYLEPAPGQASLNLLKMAREGLLMELRVAIDKARKQNAPVRRERLSIKQDGGLAQVTLEVIPVSGPARERNYLVLFEPVPPSGEPRAPGRAAPRGPRQPAVEHQIKNLHQELTATKEYLQSLIPADVGRPIGDIRLSPDLPDLEQVCKHVVDTATVVEREVRDRDGRWYSLRVRPYTTADDQIDGTVIILTDITALKSSVEQVSVARDHAETIMDNVPVPLIILDAALRVTWASRSFYETFRVTPEETIEHFIYELGNGQWNIPALRKALAEVVEKNVEFHEFEVEHDRGRVGAKTMLLNARPMHWENEAGRMILLAIDDITTRREAERGPRPPG